MSYEILTIASADLSEKEQQELSKKIQDLIKKDNGKIVSEKSLGTKKFAYPMKKQETGTYLSISVELLPANIKSLKKELQSNEQIINVFIFKLPPQSKIKAKKAKSKLVKTETQAEKFAEKPKKRSEAESFDLSTETNVKVEAESKEGIEIKQEEKLVTVKPIEHKKTTKKVSKVKPVPKPAIATEIEDEEDRLKKLDEKLDEILKE